MTATEELRRLLDERGVEWESGLPTETIVREPNDALYVERPDGRMHVYFRSYLTPAQAITATLGPCSDSCNCTNSERTNETCRIEEYEESGISVCSECGAAQPDDFTVYYCWCCGRKVVDG